MAKFMDSEEDSWLFPEANPAWPAAQEWPA